jgi:hypothetical protein
LKNGNKIAKIIVQTIAQTQIITIGSIAVDNHLTITSISLLNLFETFKSKSGIFHVCSHIFTTEASSKGKYSSSFHSFSFFIHKSSLKAIHSFNSIEISSILFS